MPLKLTFEIKKDPDGHNQNLRLQGDWIELRLSDGDHCGVGEASHSGDDAACMETVRQLCDVYLRHFQPSVEKIRHLEKTVFSRPADFVAATAMSAINQALYDLLAKQEGLAVWQLFSTSPAQAQIPFYVTINRALRKRTKEEYIRICGEILSSGITNIKCAPFDTVEREMDAESQVKAAEKGLGILSAINETYPVLKMRVDFHNRFHLESFSSLLPEFEAFGLEWLEEPCQRTDDNALIRQMTKIPMAAGELYFGSKDFIRLMDAGLADVIMPDIKHVGGLGPLITVCREAQARGVSVSPHNPSGPAASRLSLQAAAVSTAVTSIETAWLSTGETTLPAEAFDGGKVRINNV